KSGLKNTLGRDLEIDYRLVISKFNTSASIAASRLFLKLTVCRLRLELPCSHQPTLSRLNLPRPHRCPCHHLYRNHPLCYRRDLRDVF
ncbi:LOW QUALITY PROTEIN: hypothetical protein TorRG33x02_219270, partial [Trema orientale]